VLEQSCSNISESLLVGATNTESFGLGKQGPSFGNSKGFFMFSAADASSTIDFSRAPIDDGVVETPPSKDVGQTIVYSSSPLRSSRRNGVCRPSSDGYTRSAHLQQLYGPSQICSAFEMTNAGESSPFSGQDGSEIQLQAPYRTDSRVKRMAEEQIPKKMGATSEPNQSGQRIL
jgi:hypothetical protein